MKIQFVVASASISLALWGCGGDNDTTGAPAPAPPPSPPSPPSPAPAPPSPPSPAGPGTIAQTAQNTPALSLLVKALEAAELVAKFNDPAANFTVFAPTDDAFTRALDDPRFKLLLDDDNKTLLTYVLQQHVVSGVLLSGDLTEGPQVVDSLNRGVGLMIELSGGNVTVQMTTFLGKIDPNEGQDPPIDPPIDDPAQVTTPDVVCSNGVVHIVDSIIVPNAVENILQFASRDSSLTSDTSSLGKLFSENGLAETLTGVGPFTVFAPDGPLLDDFNKDFETPELRRDALEFHVFPELLLRSDLKPGNKSLTMVNGKVLEINYDDEVITFLGPNSGGRVTVPIQRRLTNGVILYINKILQAEETAGLVFK